MRALQLAQESEFWHRNKCDIIYLRKPPFLALKCDARDDDSQVVAFWGDLIRQILLFVHAALRELPQFLC